MILYQKIKVMIFLHKMVQLFWPSYMTQADKKTFSKLPFTHINVVYMLINSLCYIIVSESH